MPLNLPNLDDRSFDDLLAEALDEIKKQPGLDWNDLSPSDPGIVLLEAFAYLTEQLIYRLNRLPEKVYIAFLRLLGHKQNPPCAAKIDVTLRRRSLEAGEGNTTLTGGRLILKAGTRLAAADSEGGLGGVEGATAVFHLDADLVFPAGQPEFSAQTTAHHFAYVAGELVATGSGLPGLTCQVQQPPIVDGMGTQFDPVVAVELSRKEVQTLREEPPKFHRADKRLNRARQFEIFYERESQKYFRVWREVENFANLELQQADGAFFYTLDRLDGRIQFAPAARYLTHLRDAQTSLRAPTQLESLAAIPPQGSEIRVWYAHGGGPAGNIPLSTPLKLHEADLIEILAAHNLDPSVTLPLEISWSRAKPGLPAESLENALIRGPLQVFAMQRAIKAAEIEAVAIRAAALAARAKAYAQREKWEHAQPGTVELVLVDQETDQEIREQAASRKSALEDVALALREKTPLGIRTDIKWVRNKQIAIAADVELEADAGQRRMELNLEGALRQYLSALPSDHQPQGWPFGRGLQIKELYHFLNRQENVYQVLAITASLATAPDARVTSLAADYHQPHAWFATSGARLFRSLNDGQGWELMAAFDPASATLTPDMPHGDDVSPADTADDHFALVKPNPYQAGVVAAVTHHFQGIHGAEGAEEAIWHSRLYITADCWESIPASLTDFHFRIEDLAWLRRARQTYLLLATDRGLFQLRVASEGETGLDIGDGDPIPILPSKPHHGLYAVTVLEGQNGHARVAVALKAGRGVFVSKSSTLTAGSRPVTEAEDALRQRMRVESLLGKEIPPTLWEQLQKLPDAAPDVVEELPHEAWEGLRGVQGEDIRHLHVQYHEDYVFLWAAAMAEADRGRGCFRWRFDVNVSNRSAGAWVNSAAWLGGSCLALAFAGGQVFAATAWGGILTLVVDPDQPLAEVWRPLPRERLPRLPLPRQETPLENRAAAELNFLPLVTIASNVNRPAFDSQKRPQQPIVMTGGPHGIYRTDDLGQTYTAVARREFSQPQDVVTLPPNWLFASGPHVVKGVPLDGLPGRVS